MWEPSLPHFLCRNRTRACVDPHAPKSDLALASAAVCRLDRWSLRAAYQLARREDPVLRTLPGDLLFRRVSGSQPILAS